MEHVQTSGTRKIEEGNGTRNFEKRNSIRKRGERKV